MKEAEFLCPLHLYLQPPSENVTLSSAYISSFERFEVLRLLDAFGDIELLKLNDVNDIIDEIYKKGYLETYKIITRNYDSLEDESTFYKLDNISHFVLCIGCSRTQSLQKWFIKQETKLLYIKWKFLSALEKVNVLESQNIPFLKVDNSEKLDLLKHHPSFINIIFDLFKIKFTEISRVINNKEFLLINGYVYIPLDKLVVALINLFEEITFKKMTDICKNLLKIRCDSRIVSVSTYIEKQLVFSDSFKGVKRVVTPNMVNKLAKESFPLCMNITNFYLNKNHHLKNGGRFQYGLFLKGIGMPLSEALEFWRNHFTKIMDRKIFDKHYSYHVRHIYGTVGRMFSYPPRNCYKILKVVPGPQEYHGCPFRTLDKESVMFELKRNQIRGKEADEIWKKMDNGLPQLACTKYYNVIHKSDEVLIKHPNYYFERSQELRNSKAEERNKYHGQAEEKNCEPCLKCNRKQIDW